MTQLNENASFFFYFDDIVPFRRCKILSDYPIVTTPCSNSRFQKKNVKKSPTDSQSATCFYRNLAMEPKDGRDRDMHRENGNPQIKFYSMERGYDRMNAAPLYTNIEPYSYNHAHLLPLQQYILEQAKLSGNQLFSYLTKNDGGNYFGIETASQVDSSTGISYLVNQIQHKLGYDKRRYLCLFKVTSQYPCFCKFKNSCSAN